MNLNFDIVILALTYTSPLIAFFLVRKLRNQAGETPVWLIIVCVFTLLSGCVLPMTGSSFTTRSANLLYCDSIILAYCCIVVVIWHWREPIMRAVYGTLALLPLLAVYLVVFMMTDFSQGHIWGSSDHGYKRIDFAHGYACEYSEYRAYLYHEWTVFPLIEHEVDEQFKSTSDGVQTPNCEILMSSYKTFLDCHANSADCHQ